MRLAEVTKPVAEGAEIPMVPTVPTVKLNEQKFTNVVNIPAVEDVRGRVAQAACPLRPGQPCNLCHPDAWLGPQDCPTVAIVMADEDLRAELARRRAAFLKSA